MISTQTVVSILKIGLGPSSSHTVAPMVMCNMYLADLEKMGKLESVKKLDVTFYGSFSLTGKGHLTDIATMLGLTGFAPDGIHTAEIDATIAEIKKNGCIKLNHKHCVPFNPDKNIIYSQEFLPEHENALSIKTLDAQGNVILDKAYLSLGGGFAVEREKYQPGARVTEDTNIAYAFKNAAELKALCEKENISIDEAILRRDSQFHSREELKKYLHEVWDAMQEAIAEGTDIKNKDKPLSGGLQVTRRAPGLYEKLQKTGAKVDDLTSLDWIAAFAMAVNEESSQGHRVVTAPTNGSCGVLPAVLAYYRQVHGGILDEQVEKFLITACAVGFLYRRNGSISGAEAGCQAEIGASSSMAAAGLAAILGGSIDQIYTAAVLAMEHFLGVTCDACSGIPQIPCISRNAFGAVKAVLAARMAMNNLGEKLVTLDIIIDTMLKTGKDMDRGYRETGLKGLSAQIKPCPLS